MGAGRGSTHLIKHRPADIPAAQGVVAQGQQLCGVGGREAHAVDGEIVWGEDERSSLGCTALNNKSQLTDA